MDYKLQYQNTKCSTKFRHLGIGTEHNFLNGTYISQNPIENAIDKYKDRSSHIATKTYGRRWFIILLCFQTVTQDKIVELIANLDTKKAVHSKDIWDKLIKEFVCLF